MINEVAQKRHMPRQQSAHRGWRTAHSSGPSGMAPAPDFLLPILPFSETATDPTTTRSTRTLESRPTGTLKFLTPCEGQRAEAAAPHFLVTPRSSRAEPTSWPPGIHPPRQGRVFWEDQRARPGQAGFPLSQEGGQGELAAATAH